MTLRYISIAAAALALAACTPAADTTEDTAEATAPVGGDTGAGAAMDPAENRSDATVMPGEPAAPVSSSSPETPDDGAMGQTPSTLPSDGTRPRTP